MTEENNKSSSDVLSLGLCELLIGTGLNYCRENELSTWEVVGAYEHAKLSVHKFHCDLAEKAARDAAQSEGDDKEKPVAFSQDEGEDKDGK